MNAQQAGDDGVAARLRRKAFARIDQQHGEIRIGRRGDHIARILFVAGGVGDDKGTPRCRKITPGDVDSDALCTFGFEPIEQQSVIDLAAVGAVPF